MPWEPRATSTYNLLLCLSPTFCFIKLASGPFFWLRNSTADCYSQHQNPVEHDFPNPLPETGLGSNTPQAFKKGKQCCWAAEYFFYWADPNLLPYTVLTCSELATPHVHPHTSAPVQLSHWWYLIVIMLHKRVYEGEPMAMQLISLMA